MPKRKREGGTLFANPPPERDERPAPPEVVRELIDVHGLNPYTARRLPLRVAYARLWAARRKCMTFGPQGRREVAGEVAGKLRAALAEDITCTRTLTNLCLEALCVCDSTEVERVAAGLANLLESLAA